ncbi:MAG: DUF899 family protein, partial [Solirubrobacteraceae bacterium]
LELLGHYPALGGQRYQPLHAVPAELLSRAGDADGAVGAYERPIALSSNAVERVGVGARCADRIPTAVQIVLHAATSYRGPNQAPSHCQGRTGHSLTNSDQHVHSTNCSTQKEATMQDESTNPSRAPADATPQLPLIVDRATWQAELNELRTREKAHTRAGDAIAAARRKLPMVEVDPTITLIGPEGPVTLLHAFEGRQQLIAYYFMWYTGKPAAEQCDGCTRYTSHIGELSSLHDRDITYATFCQGPYEESVQYRDFMGWTMPWYSAHSRLTRF